MGTKDQKTKASFEVIREGFARARFGGALSGCSSAEVGGPITFAAVENNGGLNPEEFYVTAARLLSQAVTPYRKFDLTQPGVLKAAVGLFEGLTLYANHWPDVNNWKGLVQDCNWDDQNDPPGINAMLVIDKTIDPKLARGVEIKALRAVSVTIWFEYTKSHPDLANFYDRLGEEVDGEMVRLIVTRITNAGEVSIVWEGEDPFAKTLGAELSAFGTQTNPGGNEMKVSPKTLVLLGLAANSEPTAEQLETVLTTLADKVTALESANTALKDDADLGKQLLAETRQRAVTLYKAAKGDKALERFVTGVIDHADLATARALIEEYQAEVEERTPLACPKCGEKLSRRSSLAFEVGENVGKRTDDYKVK